MAMLAKKIQPAKTAAIEAAKKTLGEYNDFIFTEYRGMTVEQITRLRDKLREKDSAVKVFKNNFARIAFEGMDVTNVSEYLKGPTAIAMAKQDSNETAKILYDFAQEVPALKIKGALVNKEIYDAAKTEAYSKVPGKKQLIAMLMSAINGPAQKLAATLQAYVEKLEKEGGAPAPKQDAAPAAAETSKEEAAPAAATAPAEAPKEEAAPAADSKAADAPAAEAAPQA